jgi:hypothetical protein
MEQPPIASYLPRADGALFPMLHHSGWMLNRQFNRKHTFLCLGTLTEDFRIRSMLGYMLLCEIKETLDCVDQPL